MSLIALVIHSYTKLSQVNSFPSLVNLDQTQKLTFLGALLILFCT